MLTERTKLSGVSPSELSQTSNGLSFWVISVQCASLQGIVASVLAFSGANGL